MAVRPAYCNSRIILLLLLVLLPELACADGAAPFLPDLHRAKNLSIQLVKSGGFADAQMSVKVRGNRLFIDKPAEFIETGLSKRERNQLMKDIYALRNGYQHCVLPESLQIALSWPSVEGKVTEQYVNSCAQTPFIDRLRARYLN